LHAFLAGLAFVAGGVVLLAARVNGLAAVLALLAAAVYVLAYTPLKPRSTLCTLAGAVVGAIPPMIGWAAATGSLAPGAWILAAVLFVWQIPHFLSLAWLYRRDYERGGFRMLPVIDESGVLTCRMAVIYSMALLPIGLAATWAGVAGWVYAAGSCVLALGMVAMALRFAVRREDADARRLFLASLVYLPLLLVLLVADRGPVAESIVLVGSLATGSL
jgi:protoheme IX farnesyltransferase